MKCLVIEGNHKLKGTIEVSVAKNSAVALIPASILADDVVTIDNIPNISDIDSLTEILEYLGAKVTREKNQMKIDPRGIINKEIPKEISSKLRASYYFMSALFGKYKTAHMYFPGGCSIGARPIDQTLKAFECLGAKVVEQDNKFDIEAEQIKGSKIYLDCPSVGATINGILASVLAEGVTEIENAAKEPEIVNVATFLNTMGANIKGAGTSHIKIIGTDHLKGCYHEVIPDRIEAGTYIIAGALLGDPLKVSGIIPEHVESLLTKLKESGIPLEVGEDYVIVSHTPNMKPISVKTLGYPGFPTDLQQPLTVLLTQMKGKSTLRETIYENRFQNVRYLNEMGAKINVKDSQNIEIKGPTKLEGCFVEATDLRAGACMILAGLCADGVTTISKIEHVLRGYENITGKFTNVGAKIEIKEIELK